MRASLQAAKWTRGLPVSNCRLVARKLASHRANKRLSEPHRPRQRNRRGRVLLSLQPHSTRARACRRAPSFPFYFELTISLVKQHFYCGFTEFNPRFSLVFWRRVPHEELAEGGVAVVDVKMLLYAALSRAFKI
jgi:hypothetical protein